ncbi:MAG: hypothetical protein KJ871_01040 [Alphaproteobacteria bacterium]|nr:hypothetical protein [Alphaproteobacteria bacterium]MBU2085877.1 hypothetical protein [Alphaproteobacteria bacterium]MBU2141538.1 hypothetical protein [Alphaproteobacteria bacterium]MBU2195707.1 hypothetical protein [Alphaproteobacteria bacterium]
MIRKTLPKEARPRTSPAEADQIQTAARSRRRQMEPGEGPHAPERDEPVAHFRGDESEIVLGGPPEDAHYTEGVPLTHPESDSQTPEEDEIDDDKN